MGEQRNELTLSGQWVNDPHWQTRRDLRLAEEICEDRAFEGMAILNDALDKAGCDDRAILDSCCQTELHGFWVLDLFLGKE